MRVSFAMRFAILALAALTCASPQPPEVSRQPPTANRQPSYDLVIRGGEILDGTGAPKRRADIAIRGDSIVAVGNVEGDAKVTLDATGQIVAPGFIDLLGNSQAAVLIDPNLEGKIRQGVTTEVTGEGHSPGPVDEAMAAEMERTKPAGWPAVTWRTLGDFMRVVEQRGSALNFAFYVGAANPREMVLGHADRAPSDAELARMKEIVAQAKREGAVGLASALIYPPGRFATTHELTEMARVAGSYWTHLRNESGNIEAAIDEAVRIARDANVPLNIFHLKIGGRENWGKMPRIVEKIERSGVDVASCVYPYTATSTDLTSIVPAWALEGGYAEFLNRLKDPAQRERVKSAMKEGRLRDASTIMIRGTGKRLDALARERKMDAADVVLQAFESDRKSPLAIFFSLDENDMKHALVQPWVAVCSDSGAVVGEMRKGGAHPRAYASFARIFRYVREEKLMTLEETVRKMTSLAASRAGLRDRGVLREGMKADVVVFDPAKVRDLSTYEDPHHFSVGVAHVVVNGTPVLRDGKMTGALPGRILRSAAPGPS